MNLLFLKVLKRKKTGDSAAVVAAPLPRIEKPASERFGKTVTPSVTREPGPDLARDRSFSPSVPTLPFFPKTVSLGGNGTPGKAAKSPERTIALPLAEIIPQIPPDLLRATEVDPQQRILLQAAEVERGMANGHPTVLLRAVYQQVPEIFNGDVSATDPREIPLPVAKVLEQFVSFKVRGDQVCEQAAPQIETPFLKATIEDSERFGTLVSPLPPAAAEPEQPTKVRPLAPIRLSVPKEPDEPADGSSAETPIRLDQLPARPPLARIPPNGTGAPAIERVPASGGPSVLTPSPAPATTPVLPKLSLKITPPSNDLRSQSRAETPAASAALEPLAFSDAGTRIRLPLRAVLRGILPFQLKGPLEEVPAAAEIELPFSIIEPQLSLGRIAISPAQFHTSMPEECRHFFKLDEGGMPVSLPLPDVLQNLPNESLQLRGDQVETEMAENFETPFAQKAAEDAARLKVPVGPIAKATSSPDLDPSCAEPEVSAETPPVPAPERRTALQTALETDDALDAKSIVAHASRLPGVSACAIVLSDGLSLAGNIPGEYGADALCAIAPSIVRRIGEQMNGTNLGALQGITLFCAKTPVSFFAHGNVCLAALHSAGEIAPEIRARLNCTTEELARMYAPSA